MHVEEMIDANPASAPFEASALATAIKACFACEEACSACADACLSEADVAAMVACVRLDLVCADMCGTTGRALARQGTDAEALRVVLEACIALCTRCGDECRGHSKHHDHCRLCAEACDECTRACGALLGR